MWLHHRSVDPQLRAVLQSELDRRPNHQVIDRFQRLWRQSDEAALEGGPRGLRAGAMPTRLSMVTSRASSSSLQPSVPAGRHGSTIQRTSLVLSRTSTLSGSGRPNRSASVPRASSATRAPCSCHRGTTTVDHPTGRAGSKSRVCTRRRHAASPCSRLRRACRAGREECSAPALPRGPA